MADNIKLNVGTGGEDLATDQVPDNTGPHYQLVKLVDATANVATRIAAGGGVEANALRVTIASDSTGVVSVDDNGGSLTVDGTVTAHLAAGTNNIGDVDVLTLPPLPAGTNNIGDVDVLTLPPLPAGTNNIGDVDVVSLPPLPAGTNNIGDVDVLTLPPLPAGNNNIGDVDVLSLPSLPAGNNNIGDVDVVSLPATTLAGGNLVQADYDTGAGVQNIPLVGVAIPAAGGGVPGGTLTNPLRVDPTGTTTQPISGTVTANQGTPAAAANRWPVQVTDGTDLAQVTTAGALVVDGSGVTQPVSGSVNATLTPATSGGLSIFRSLDLDETEEDVKTSPGHVYGLWFTNTATTTRWLKFYNATAANVVVGTTTPVLTIGLPGNTSDDITGVFDSTHGIAFSTAICVAATTGPADNDTGAPGVGDVVVNIFYK